jgi:hypothetical protein
MKTKAFVATKSYKEKMKKWVPYATHQTEGESHQDVSKIVAMPCNAPAETETDINLYCIV